MAAAAGLEPAVGEPKSPALPLGYAAVWGWRQDLNLQPSDYKSAALPIELRQHGGANGDRTRNLRLAKPLLSRLSYGP